jgi:tripartite-type tricarboxylate transporter receptor subunit TctC
MPWLNLLISIKVYEHQRYESIKHLIALSKSNKGDNMEKFSNWNRRKVLHGLAATGLLPVAAIARAQPNYPERPILIVVPYAAGGHSDFIAREVAQGLAKRLGQIVMIENKPGANSVIGTDFVAKSPPDGYTFGVVVTGYTINPSVYTKLPYRQQDLAPVSQLTQNSLIGATGLPGIRNLADFIREAQTKGISYASSGIGSAVHLLSERFVRAAKITNAVHVPYKSAAEPLRDLITGRVSLLFDGINVLGPHFKSGQLAPLAVTGTARESAFPDVPTLKELGYGIIANSWVALLAPAQTPQAIIDRVAAETDKVLHEKELQAKFAERGIEAVGGTPADLNALLTSESKIYGDLVKQLGISMDLQQ